MRRLLLKHIGIDAQESLWHDLIRCALVVQVVLGHMAALALPTIPELRSGAGERVLEIAFRLVTRFGAEAAYLFVFLSGFMVGGALLHATRERAYPTAAEFFLRRMKRIVPIAILAIGLTAFLDIIAVQVLNKGHIYQCVAGYDAVKSLNWPVFFGNILFLEPTFVHTFGSNGPLWTLGYIFQYYIVGYIFFRFSTINWWVSITALIALLLAMTLVDPEWSILFVVWLIGAVTRAVHTPAKFELPCLIVGGFLFAASNLMSPLFAEASSAVVGFLLVAWTRTARLRLPVTSAKLVRVAASESYTVYAVHYPVLIFVFATLFGAPAGSFAEFSVFLALSWLFVALATFLVSKTNDALFTGFSPLLAARRSDKKE